MSFQNGAGPRRQTAVLDGQSRKRQRSSSGSANLEAAHDNFTATAVASSGQTQMSKATFLLARSAVPSPVNRVDNGHVDPSLLSSGLGTSSMHHQHTVAAGFGAPSADPYLVAAGMQPSPLSLSLSRRPYANNGSLAYLGGAPMTPMVMTQQQQMMYAQSAMLYQHRAMDAFGAGPAVMAAAAMETAAAAASIAAATASQQTMMAPWSAKLAVLPPPAHSQPTPQPREVTTQQPRLNSVMDRFLSKGKQPANPIGRRSVPKSQAASRGSVPKPSQANPRGSIFTASQAKPPQIKPPQASTPTPTPKPLASSSGKMTPGRAPSSPTARKVTWEWVGEAIKDPQFFKEPVVNKRCKYYRQARSTSAGYTLSLGDAVMLKAHDDEAARPYVARVRGFSEDIVCNDENKMYVVIEWFFRPEEMKGGRDNGKHGKDELFLKKTGIQVRAYFIECIDSPCRVVTYPAYCRMRSEEKAREVDGLPPKSDPSLPLFFVRNWHDNDDNYKSVQKKKRRHGGAGSRLAVDAMYNALHINKRNIKGETKLHAACIRGNVEDVRHLIRMNAACDVSDNAGWTPLHEACLRNHIEIARLLIRHRVDVNVLGPTGTMPLHDAAENQSLEMVQLLVRNGASTKIPDGSGNLPVDLAQGSKPIMELLSQQRERRAAAVACELSNALTGVKGFSDFL